MSAKSSGRRKPLPCIVEGFAIVETAKRQRQVFKIIYGTKRTQWLGIKIFESVLFH